MGVFTFIQRKYMSALALGNFGNLAGKGPTAPARRCEFGHPVFSGNNLCTYGHHAADKKSRHV
jgi:hypothetical protein